LMFPDSLVNTTSFLFGALGTLIHTFIFKYRINSKFYLISNIIFLIMQIFVISMFFYLGL
jgi:uncharacterized membrane protein YsdA (DUF1294 family)